MFVLWRKSGCLQQALRKRNKRDLAAGRANNMTSMTSTGPMVNSVLVTAPHNRYPVALGGISQVPMYPAHPVPGNAPGFQLPMYTPAQRAFKEGRVLGALQILLGLVHIGLGIILGTIPQMYYTAVSFYGGYPFWGGIMFLITGSLTVSSDNLPSSSCLRNGSLGLNIVSAIFSLVGIALFIADLSINVKYINSNYYPYYDMFGISGAAISGVLFIFSLLEFSIACTCAHFGCQLIHDSQNTRAAVIPSTQWSSRNQ